MDTILFPIFFDKSYIAYSLASVMFTGCYQMVYEPVTIVSLCIASNCRVYRGKTQTSMLSVIEHTYKSLITNYLSDGRYHKFKKKVNFMYYNLIMSGYKFQCIY